MPTKLKTTQDFIDGYDKGRTEAIAKCVEILRDSFPITDNEDILYGLSCAIYSIEQLKENK